MKYLVQQKKAKLQQTIDLYEKLVKESQLYASSEIKELTEQLERKEQQIILEEEKVTIRMRKVKQLKDSNLVQKERLDQMQDVRNRLLQKLQYISNFQQNAKYNSNISEMETYIFKKDLNDQLQKNKNQLSFMQNRQNYNEGLFVTEMNKYAQTQETIEEREKEKQRYLNKIKSIQEEQKEKARKKKEKMNKYEKLYNAFKEIYEKFLKQEFNENFIDFGQIIRKYQEFQLTLSSCSSQFNEKMTEQLQHQKEIEDLQIKLEQLKEKNSVNTQISELRRKSSNKFKVKIQSSSDQHLYGLFPFIREDASWNQMRYQIEEIQELDSCEEILKKAETRVNKTFSQTSQMLEKIQWVLDWIQRHFGEHPIDLGKTVFKSKEIINELKQLSSVEINKVEEEFLKVFPDDKQQAQEFVERLKGLNQIVLLYQINEYLRNKNSAQQAIRDIHLIVPSKKNIEIKLQTTLETLRILLTKIQQTNQDQIKMHEESMSKSDFQKIILTLQKFNTLKPFQISQSMNERNKREIQNKVEKSIDYLRNPYRGKPFNPASWQNVFHDPFPTQQRSPEPLMDENSELFKSNRKSLKNKQDSLQKGKSQSKQLQPLNVYQDISKKFSKQILDEMGQYEDAFTELRRVKKNSFTRIKRSQSTRRCCTSQSRLKTGFTYTQSTQHFTTTGETLDTPTQKQDLKSITMRKFFEKKWTSPQHIHIQQDL